MSLSYRQETRNRPRLSGCHVVASCFVASALLLGGCTEYITPPAYTLQLRAEAPSQVAQGCPVIGSEWLDKLNVHDKVRRAPHVGIDIHGPRGTPILAAAPGRVLLVDATSDGGQFIAIHHGADAAGHHVYSTYWHLDSYAVSAGDQVERGQAIGTMGATGTDAGGWDNYHLHMVPLVGPPPPEFNGGKLTPLQFFSYRDLTVNPRFLWYPYAPDSSPTSSGIARGYDPSQSYGDASLAFAGLTYPVPCQDAAPAARQAGKPVTARQSNTRG